MTRRSLLLNSSLACAASGNLGLFAQNPITFNGELGFQHVGDEWKVRPKDFTIDGLPIPKFGWVWVGTMIAQGVILSIGAPLFGALEKAILGGGGGPSIAELLQIQLREFARIVDEKFDQRALDTAAAHLESYCRRFKEFSGNDVDRSLLLANTSDTLSELKSPLMKFIGYRTFMSCAGLRLAILKTVTTNVGRRNFESQVAEAISHHRSVADLIVDETSLGRMLERGDFTEDRPDLSKKNGFRLFEIPPKKICGVFVAGQVATDMHYSELPQREAQKAIMDNRGAFSQKPNWVSLLLLRKRLQAENTDLGNVIVSRWSRA